MKTKIIHKECGGQVAWYLRDVPREPDLMLAKDVERMDGTKPSEGDIFRETCPVCGALITDARQIERCFET